MNAKQIIALLEARHHKDVFIPECKDGPTVGSSHSRLDGWAMRRSWVNPCFWGYEVKVSRSDFLGDNKWQNYLSTCNQFYFVAPRGLIDRREIPEQAGLLEVASTGSMLRTIRKAPHRELSDPPVDVMIYALMRARSFDLSVYRGVQDVGYWRKWLSEKEEDRYIGRQCSKAMAQKYEREVESVRAENNRLRAELERLQDVRQAVHEAGLSFDRYRPGASIVEWLGAKPTRKVLGIARRLQSAAADFIETYDKESVRADQAGDHQGGPPRRVQGPDF